MPQVKKKPYKNSQDLKAALNIIQDAAPQNGTKLWIIADLILHTGATLPEVLELTEEDFIKGENFTVEHNPNRTYSLRSYFHLPMIRRLKDRDRRGITTNKPFFSNGGKVFSDGYVRSVFSKISSKTGYDVSLIRFQKTFYLDYLIRHGSLDDVAPAATKDIRFNDEAYILKTMALSSAEYLQILNGEWNPIVDDKKVDYTDALLEETVNELKDTLSDAEHSLKRLPPKSKEKSIVMMRFMIEQLNLMQQGQHTAFGNNRRE